MQPPHEDNAIPLSLPKPVATYLAAVKAKNADMLALCFADDARVHDENRDYRGLMPSGPGNRRPTQSTGTLWSLSMLRLMRTL